MSEAAVAKGTVATVNTRCPNCNELVTVAFRAFLEGLRQADMKDDEWRETLKDEQRLLLEEAHRSGAYPAFEDATRRVKDPMVPSNIQRFFLTWLRLCAPTTLSSVQSQALQSEFPGRLEAYQALSIGAAVVDGYLRTFFPFSSKNNKQPKFQAASVLDGWLRSRYGYVAGRGAYFEAMRANRTAAEFGRLVQ